MQYKVKVMVIHGFTRKEEEETLIVEAKNEQDIEKQAKYMRPLLTKVISVEEA